MKSFISIAKEAVFSEIEALTSMAANLDGEFDEAVKLISECEGRIIFSGIGKSAVVAQKISATFNSTGTPALFMHAADAIHGDLGMVQEKDVVVILSKSGESPEVKTLVPLVKKMGKGLIAIVGNVHSFLAQEADVILDSSVEKEACPNNLAPTSSSTTQIVMGDALAVCLMKLNHFSTTDFAKLHPGGNLGKRLYLQMEDFYKHNAKPSVRPDAELKSVIFEISRGRMGATAVTDEQRVLLGIITDGDVRRLLEKTNQLSMVLAKDLMTKEPKTVRPDLLAIEAINIIKAHDLSQLIVVDEKNRLLGFVHLHDLIREGIS